MSIQHLREKQAEFDIAISKLKDIKGKSTPIIDGIIDIEKYYHAPKKIMWVLKEVNSPDDSDEWDLRDALKTKLKTEKGMAKGWTRTFEPIVYASYAILNNTNWEDTPGVKYKPEVIDVLQQIAYINIKKIPGGSVANNFELQNAYSENKIALAQIEAFNPDIVIFGNTLNFLIEDLGIKELTCNEFSEYAVHNNRVYINAYHPANFKVRNEKYFNSIIDIVNSLN